MRGEDSYQGFGGRLTAKAVPTSTEEDSPTQRQNFSGTLGEGLGLAAAV